MADPMSMMDVPHAAAVGAEVNTPEQVTLYDQTGRTVLVPAGEVEHWIATYGFSRSLLDAEALAAEIPILSRETERAWAEYVRGVTTDGYIDTSDVAQSAAAHAALNLLTRQCALVEHAIVTRYPVRQGEGIAMVTPAGVTTAVDPGQVEWYETEHGYRRA